MSDSVKPGFTALTTATAGKGVLVVFCDDALKFGSVTRKVLGSAIGLVERAAKTERFTGKKAAALTLIMPAVLGVARLVVIGAGKAADLSAKDIVNLGGAVAGHIPASANAATVLAELPGGAMKAEQAADLALGARLRGYSFDLYKTKRADGEA
jgi:leucyl aminopeptidase